MSVRKGLTGKTVVKKTVLRQATVVRGRRTGQSTSAHDLANALGNIIRWLEHVRAILDSMDANAVVQTSVSLDTAVKEVAAGGGPGNVRVYCPPPR